MSNANKSSGTYDFEARNDHSEELVRLQKQAGLALKAESAMWRRAGMKDGMKVLDLGCGPGVTSCSIATEFPTSSVVGMDISETLLTNAKAIGAQLGINNVSFVSGDAYNLPFKDGTFDFVYSRFLFQHLREPEAVLEEISRVLKPGGVVCIMDVDDRFLLISPEPKHFQNFQKAAAEAQKAEGGNRHVGGQLFELLDRENYQSVETLVHVIRSEDCGIKSFLDVAVRFKATRIANHPKILSYANTDAALKELDELEGTRGAWGVIGMFVGCGVKPR